MRLLRLLLAAALVALALTGCSYGDPTSSHGKATNANQLLARYRLGGLGTMALINRLDRLPADARPADLTASGRPGELQLSSGKEKATMPIPRDRFYLSVAPYVDGTHACFYHSLTTCKGELGGKAMHVRIVADDGSVLVDEDRTTFANGFMGFWLPRGVKGTLSVRYGERSARTGIATDAKAPTCLTTLHLA